MFKRLYFITLIVVGISTLGYAQENTNPPIPTYPTSYDCSIATTFLEKSICQNKILADLDVDLAQTYNETVSINALYDSSQKTILKSGQLEWLKSLQNECSQKAEEQPHELSTDTVSCIYKNYTKRIAELVHLRFESLKIKRVSVALNPPISKACFQFTKPLASTQELPLRSYIELSPQRDYSAVVDDGQICLTGLPFSSQTSVVLRKGLKGKSNIYVTSDLKRDVIIGSKPQSISLGNNSYILPKMGEPLLPIKTTNYSSVYLKFYQIDERNFKSILDSDMLGNKLSGWSEDSIRDYSGAEVWSGVLDINNVKDQEVITQIPIKDMVKEFKPGIYVLVAKPSEKNENSSQSQATQWVVVTDLGLSVYKGEKGLSLQVRSLKTAEPLKNVQIKLVAKNNMVLADQKTPKNGWLDLSPALLNGKGGKEALYLTAQTKLGDFSFISLNEPALDLSDHGVGGKNPPAALQTYLYSDRGIYRPGENIKMGYLLRDDLSHAQTNMPLTFILYRPDGKEAFKSIQTPDDIGGGRFDIPISKAAATGKWRLAAYSDPKAPTLGEMSVQVEEFVPERLEVSAKSDVEKLKFGETAHLSVQADYFFGAPGSDLTINGTALLEVDHTPFKVHDKFRFGLSDDEAKNLQKLTEVKTDKKGQGVLEIPTFNEIDLSSPLKVHIKVEVADTDGRPSLTALTIPLIKQDALVGIKPNFTGEGLDYNQDALFEAISVDENGIALARRELNVEWVKEERTYNWFYESGRWKSSYQKYDIPIARETLTTDEDGKIKFKRSFDHWGYFRAIVTDMQTGAAADYTVRIGWWANAQSPDTPDALDLSIEKEDVVAGDNIKGFIKASFEGKALISVAQKNIIWKTEIELPKTGTEFTIPVEKEWGNGAYVLVTAYRAGTNDDQRGPGRAVGAKWLSFGKEQRTLKVGFDLPDEILPSSDIAVPIHVMGSVLGKEKIKVNVFAVDEGILRLTQFKSPRPDTDLLAQQKLQLAYHDLYGRLILPQKGERGTIRSGGDSSNMGNQGGLSAQVFKTVALVSQTLDIDPSGNGLAHFKVPDFNGRLRFFAVAYSETATGGGEGNLIVRTPVITDLLPSRFMAPDDTARFAFRFLNVNGEEGQYKVQLHTSDILEVENPIWSIDSKKGQKAESRFSVHAKGVGQAKLTLNVEGPHGYTQSREWDIDVRPAQQWVTQTKQMELALSENHTFDPHIFDAFLPGTGQLNLNLSARPEIDVQKLVTELDRYPYGCLEQTTSRVFPMLSFSKVQNLWKDIKFDEFGLDQKIQAGIIRILEMQRIDGSFGLWSRHSKPEPWLTAYAMDFLTEARKLGYNVLEGPFNSALNWMENAEKQANYSLDARSYMLLVLAKNDKLSTSNLKYEYNRFNQKGMSSLSRAQLVAANALKGIDAKPLSIDELTERVHMTQYFYFSYGSALRDFSAILTLPKSIFATDQARLSLLTSVLELAKSNEYTSTQEKAWLLQAAAKIAEHSNDQIKIKINDAEINREKNYRALLTPHLLSQPYKVENMQDASLFVQYSLSGIPSEPLKEEANGLSITRTILDVEGKQASLDEVKTGDKFIIVLEGESSTNLDHKAMIVDFLPAGFEIERNAFNKDLMERLGMDMKDLSIPEFKAERDDRFVAAVDLAPEINRSSKDQNTFKLIYVVRAVTPGEYVYPAPFVEDMYKPSYFARGSLSHLSVQAVE